MDQTRHTEPTPNARPTPPRADQSDIDHRAEKGGDTTSPDFRHPATTTEEGSNGHTSQRMQQSGGEADEIGRMTRDELYDRARELGIPGRSMMTKVQLLQAVRMATGSQASQQQQQQQQH